MSKKVKRLYDEFKPSNYRLELEPDKKKQNFTGKVIISGKKTGRPSKRITLHQKDLAIKKVNVLHKTKQKNEPVTIDRTNIHSGLDEVRLHSSQLIYPGEYEIEIEFEGKITKNMNGIYPCNFTHEGKDKSLIATQFESHHAREVFPCIDEPAAKATFDLTLCVPEKETVLSNTPEMSRKTSNSLSKVSFETTPVMSTYLLAFVYGEMGYKEAKTKSGIKVRAYATPDNVKFTDFSLDVAVKCLDYYEDYFGIKYPLEKCDMIALPDFASGAMENWGCITYREQCMLVDPENTSIPTKQYVAMVVAHELAHQWFGNLVTMRWWTDLWLNEGFASWIEYMAVDHIFPDWQMWTQFAVDEQQRAFKLDALEHTHPIEVAINHPDEIRTIFDTISYSKGASAIHMLNSYLGSETFRDGLRHYLKKHSYDNTDTIDLWQALEDISKKPVKDFMHAWTSLSGFPLVKVTIDKDMIKLDQSRFYINPEHSKIKATTWPIALASDEKIIPEIFAEKSMTISGTPKTKALKINIGQNGFYRTDYDKNTLNQLGSEVSNSKLQPIDRLGLLSDALEMAKSGNSTTVEFLEFLSNFNEEDNNAVWDIIASAVGSIRHIVDDETIRETMKPFISELSKKQVNRLGWDRINDESYFDLLLRPTVLALSCSADYAPSTTKAMEIFDGANSLDDISPDFKSISLSTAVRLNNDNKTFDKILKMYHSTELSEDRTIIAAALTGFKDKELYSRALNMAKSDAVRLQDVAYWVVYSFSNRFAKRFAWDWLKTNWSWLEKNIGSDLSFYRFPLYAANAFSDKDFIKEYLEFFEPLMSSALERSINQGNETLQWQTAWRERDLDNIKNYFLNIS
jgi:puromycin-sensitive aminopeptidase